MSATSAMFTSARIPVDHVGVIDGSFTRVRAPFAVGRVDGTR